jgi:hypothetical protein
MTATNNPSGRGRLNRRVAVVAGTVAGLVGLVALAGGGALVAAHESHRDSDGFYATDTTTLSTPTYALVSEGLDVGTDGPDWLFREGRLGTVRVTATGTEAKPVFIGIARTSQVDAYLRDVARDDITDFDVDPFTVELVRRAGSTKPSDPAGAGFWAEQASGSGTRSVIWPVQKGSWDVVVMNADGSLGVRSVVSVGAKIPAALWVGIGLLVAGVVLAAAGAASFLYGIRGPQDPAASEVGTAAPVVG